VVGYRTAHRHTCIIEKNRKNELHHSFDNFSAPCTLILCYLSHLLALPLDIRAKGNLIHFVEDPVYFHIRLFSR